LYGMQPAGKQTGVRYGLGDAPAYRGGIVGLFARRLAQAPLQQLCLKRRRREMLAQAVVQLPSDAHLLVLAHADDLRLQPVSLGGLGLELLVRSLQLTSPLGDPARQVAPRRPERIGGLGLLGDIDASGDGVARVAGRLVERRDRPGNDARPADLAPQGGLEAHVLRDAPAEHLEVPLDLLAMARLGEVLRQAPAQDLTGLAASERL